MFVDSKFKYSLWKWIDKLNKNINLYSFNKDSEHEKIFGKIMDYNDFEKNQNINKKNILTLVNQINSLNKEDSSIDLSDIDM